MKRISTILIAAFCLAVTGCGLSDPWKDWENSGELPADRLLPSELKATLCSAMWWKFDYADETFYWQFTEEGQVESNSTILRDVVTASYHFGWDNPQSVKLTIPGGGHMGYLASGQEETLVVTSFSDEEIVATTLLTGKTVIFTQATQADVDAMVADKAEEVAKVEAVQRIKESGLSSGAVYAGGRFVAHYFLDLSSEKYTVRFDIIDNNVLSHTVSDVSVDVNSRVTLAKQVSIAGQNVSAIEVNVSAKTASLGGNLTASANSASGDWFVTGGYKTYLINPGSSRGTGCDTLWKEISDNSGRWHQIEISDRAGRPLVFCPTGNDSSGGYCGIYYNNLAVSSQEKDIVTFGGGWRGAWVFLEDDASWFERIYSAYPLLHGFLSASDGVIVVQDGDVNTKGSKIYLMSPTTDNWIMADRDN